MATLQLVGSRFLKDTHTNRKGIKTQSVVAIHRRSQTLLTQTLVRSPQGGTERIYESHVRNSFGEWRSCRQPFTLPQEYNDCIVAILTLEAGNAFVFIYSEMESRAVRCVFLDLSCLFVNEYDLSTTSECVTCADYDQNRKELLLGSRGGRVQSYAIRCIEEPLPGDIPNKSRFIAVFRNHNRTSREAGRPAKQIVTQVRT